MMRSPCAICWAVVRRRNSRHGWSGTASWMPRTESARPACPAAFARCFRLELMKDDRDAPAPFDRRLQHAPDDDRLWVELRRLTPARIGLRRTGASLATGPLLDLQLAHARARDAVHEPLDEPRLIAGLAGLGLPVLSVASESKDRQQYLMRPDVGRRLASTAETTLAQHAKRIDYGVALVVTEGLSARAIQAHAGPVLAGVVPALRAQRWEIAPVVVVRQGRVAIGDAIANSLRANCVVVLIGERPGLSA